MERGNLRFLVLIIVYIFYLAIGAAIFSSIETPFENRVVQNVKDKRDAFLAKNPCVNDIDLEELIKVVVSARDQGISPFRNVTVPIWEFGSAFFFAGAVITTIGYGNIAPLSSGGKTFCIVYALFGIPMTAILLTAIVERLLIVAEAIQELLSRSCAVRGVPLGYMRMFHLSIIMLVILLIVMFVPAIFYSKLQGWSYFEAFYFCFISLTTIGLGDFVPGDDSYWQKSSFRAFYKVCSVFFFVIGIAFLILILELCAKVPDDHPGMLFSCHQPFLKDDDEQDLLPSKGDAVREAVAPSGSKNTYRRLSPDPMDDNGNNSSSGR
ncbi:potassium channel subfamily K member 1-like [Actinia tenebrosa]|uniref:Potassium channel subfamily K member 1-like n=1 Tax=Actinia tenebrosa TaxID=6105 RepID=A0A6P8HRR0_ACTTE|nr:potassium channel subfamily K member 1-like [Actinia tenebrosa]